MRKSVNTDTKLSDEEKSFENSLRPYDLIDFIGQKI